MTEKQWFKWFEKNIDKFYEVVAVSEYAKRAGVTRQAIEKAMVTGRIPKEAVIKITIDGKPITLINKTKADKYWVMYSNPLSGTLASQAALERIQKELEELDTENKLWDEDDMVYYDTKKKDITKRYEILINPEGGITERLRYDGVIP